MVKGIVFSVISVLIVLMFALLISFLVSEAVHETDEGLYSQVRSINQYYSLLKGHYLPSITKATSHQAVYDIVNLSIQDSVFVPPGNVSVFYKALVANGTFNKTLQGHMYYYNTSSEKNTIPYWTSYFEQAGEDIFLVDEVSIVPLFDFFTINQTNPWEITVVAYYNISVNSSDFTITDEIYPVVVSFDILGMRDPLYEVHASQPTGIVVTNVTEITNNWSISDLADALDDTPYFTNDRAPCFLQRLENMSSYYCTHAGIESLIRPELVLHGTSPLVSYNGTSRQRSYVDHFFFSNSYEYCQASTELEDYLYNISGISNVNTTYNFRLDFNSTIHYLGSDFSSANYSVVCGRGTLV